MLELPVHRYVKILLVAPHYPENVGAACRALKTMGFTRIGLVNPSKLALPSHPMAQKMAVKSLDVLDGAELFDNLDEAIVGSDIVVGTTGRRAVSGVFSPDRVAEKVLEWTRQQKRITIVFGNEKTGLTSAELAKCDAFLRVPMAAAQPSLNLAQAVQVTVYELFSKALAERAREREGVSRPAVRNGVDLLLANDDYLVEAGEDLGSADTEEVAP